MSKPSKKETPRAFTESELVLATHNQGKVQEIGKMLGDYVPTILGAADIDLPEPEETETTFVGNAVLKARAATEFSGKPALADDSGFAVYGLNGDPGVYSARWAGQPRDFNRAMEKVNETLGDNPDRRAAFICVMALAWPDGHVETFEGRIEGEVCWPPRGDKGFGYDPMFIPENFEDTFAEMNPEKKAEISHRARAFNQMVKSCFVR